MKNLTAVILFTLVILSALLTVSIANRIQTRKRLKRVKAKQLRSRIDELERIHLAISPLLESPLVLKLINEEVIDLIKSVIKLAPENEAVLSVKLKKAKELAQDYSSGHNLSQLNRIQSSDASIAKQQYHLNEAGKLIRRHKTLGRIQEAEMNANIKELSWAHLMVGVCSHLAQGQAAASKSKHMMATGHYRNAQTLLKSSQINDDRRRLLIQEVAELISGAKKKVNPALLPEAKHFPEPPNTQDPP